MHTRTPSDAAGRRRTPPDGDLRTATDDGAFANASSMDAGQVGSFLTRWAPAGDR
ncbi:hypothetical protein [Kitasatospora sp. NPDC004272]